MNKERGTYSLVATPNTFEDIIKQFHDEFGHMGIQKCYELIRTRYFWPKMEKTISEHIGSCRLCSQYKEKNGKDYAFVQRMPSDRPFQRICVDLCGPLEITRKGNRYVLGIIDHFSKFIVLVPIHSADAKTITKAVEGVDNKVWLPRNFIFRFWKSV